VDLFEPRYFNILLAGVENQQNAKSDKSALINFIRFGPSKSAEI
jgi:hypothetical protein